MKRGRSRIEKLYRDGDVQEATEIDLEELREFMMGDLLPDLADPDFKSRLRAHLWEMLKQRRGRVKSEDPL